MTSTGFGEHTVAQFGRRAGMSPTRARKLLADGKLPPPDGTNPDGENVWYAATIDRWLRVTGRPVPPGARWPQSWPTAERPLEAMPAHIRLTRDRGAALTVWQFRDGPAVVYIVGYAGEDTSDEELAAVAADYLEPTRRPGAVIMTPHLSSFGTEPHPHLELWRIPDDEAPVSRDTVEASEPADTWLPGFLRRFIAQPPTTMPRRGPVPGPRRREFGVPQWAGSVPAEEVARVIGAPIPLWREGTNTPDTLRTVQLLGQPVTLRVPDTITDWPPARDRLQAAISRNLIATHPNAFTLLAQETRSTYADVHHAHQVPLAGDGWYVPAVPEPPQWPVVLEHRATIAADRPFDLDGAADELRSLRRDEQDLPWLPDDHYAAAVALVCRAMEAKLVTSHPEAVYDRAVCYRWPDVTGPVYEEYRRGLTPLPVDDPHGDTANPSRRLARLLTEDASDNTIVRHQMLDHARAQLRGLYRDPAGRLVAELAAGTSRDACSLVIEWPVGMPPNGWRPDTVIAADRTVGATGVFALTAGPDGALLPPEPVPNPGGTPRFTFGYDGNSPAILYQALVRCVLHDWTAAARESWVTRLRGHNGDEPGRSSSELWNQITTSTTTLRLSWADVRRWVLADAKRIGYTTP